MELLIKIWASAKSLHLGLQPLQGPCQHHCWTELGWCWLPANFKHTKAKGVLIPNHDCSDHDDDQSRSSFLSVETKRSFSYLTWSLKRTSAAKRWPALWMLALLWLFPHRFVESTALPEDSSGWFAVNYLGLCLPTVQRP